MKRYNKRVPPLEKPSPDEPVPSQVDSSHADSRQEDSHPHHRHAAYAAETTGLLIIAVLLLVLTLIRYWHSIHWSLR